MKVALYEYNGATFLRPQYHVVTDAAPADCVETMHRDFEEKSGGPVTVERIAVTECRRPRRMMQWFKRIIERGSAG